MPRPNIVKQQSGIREASSGLALALPRRIRRALRAHLSDAREGRQANFAATYIQSKLNIIVTCHVFLLPFLIFYVDKKNVKSN